MTEPTTDPKTRVARDLREIVELCTRLEAQAEHKANDPLMPGGLVMVALGGVANVEAYLNKLDTAEEIARAQAYRFGLDLEDVWPAIEEDDFEPPLQTLVYWSEKWRAATGKEYDDFTPTVTSEASFIRWALDWAMTNEPKWEAFTTDINAARRNLESLLYAGLRKERTRVRCDRPPCTKKPPLIRVRAERKIIGWYCGTCGTENTHHDTICTIWHRCGNIQPLEPMWFSDPADDHYMCTCCKVRYTEDEFQRALGHQLRHDERAEQFVILGDALATLKAQGRSKATVREWMKVPEHVADRCTRCQQKYEPTEHAACPRPIVDPRTKQYRYDDNGKPITCGGLLDHVYYPDLDDITEGWCELGTRRRWVWWPDLWRKHLTTPKRKKRVA